MAEVLIICAELPLPCRYEVYQDGEMIARFLSLSCQSTFHGI